MKSGTGLALAIAGGYLLGRRRKFRLALITSGALATGKIGSAGGKLLKRGLENVGVNSDLAKTSPAVGKLSGLLTDQLAGAGKAAALAAVTSKVDSLADIVHDRAETIRQGGSTDSGTDENSTEDDGSTREARRGQPERRGGREGRGGQERPAQRTRDGGRQGHRSAQTARRPTGSRYRKEA